MNYSIVIAAILTTTLLITTQHELFDFENDILTDIQYNFRAEDINTLVIKVGNKIIIICIVLLIVIIVFLHNTLR